MQVLQNIMLICVKRYSSRCAAEKKLFLVRGNYPSSDLRPSPQTAPTKTRENTRSKKPPFPSLEKRKKTAKNHSSFLHAANKRVPTVHTWRPQGCSSASRLTVIIFFGNLQKSIFWCSTLPRPKGSTGKALLVGKRQVEKARPFSDLFPTFWKPFWMKWSTFHWHLSTF